MLRVFGEYFDVEELEDTVTAFDLGSVAETGSEKQAAGYEEFLNSVDGMNQAVGRLTEDSRPEVIAYAVEFILEGLHLNRRLNCERTPTGYRYKR